LSKALYLSFAGEGHINPSLGLVHELLQRGEEVIYYSTEEYKEKIVRTGALFRPLKSMISQKEQNSVSQLMKSNPNFHPIEIKNRFLLYILETLPDVLKQVKDDHIDYVIFDTQFILGKIVARQLRVPCVSFCTTFGWAKGAPNVLEKMLPAMNNVTEPDPTLVKQERELSEQLSNKYKFSIPDFPEILFNNGDITLICTSKYFQPGSEYFDDTFKFIGPSLTQRNDTGDFPVNALKDRRTIYISMGTVVNEQKELYTHCLQAFADIDAIVVMSIGKRLDIHDFKDIPPNFIVRNYVPQLEILQHTDVFLTHCGMNSTSEALYYNVPLVMNPIFADQPMVAERVKSLGAGIKLDKSQLHSAGLRKAVETVLLDKQYKENAAKIGESLRRCGGYRYGVDEIFSLKKSLLHTKV
jgi:MGT family glycosyltransferase